MSRHLMGFFVLICFLQASGQQYLRGIIVSADDSSQVIPYVNISKQNQFQGTITNAKGEFCLKNVYPNDTFLVSCIGYKPQTLVLSDKSIKEVVTVKLETEIYSIDEITVLALSAAEIIVETKKRLSQNCPEIPTRLTGLYRKQVVEDKQYAFLGNSLLDVDCPKFWSESASFTKKEYIKARSLNEKITNSKIDKRIEIEIKPIYVLGSIYPQDILSMTDIFELQIKRIILTDSCKLYKIHFKTAQKYWDTYPFEGNMYIENTNFALICFEIEKVRADEIIKIFSMKDKKSYNITIHTNRDFKRVEYKKQLDNWIFSYSKSLWDFNSKSIRDEFNHNYILTSDFMVNKTYPYDKTFPSNQQIDIEKDFFGKLGKKPTTVMDSLNSIQPDYGNNDRY